MKQKKYLYIGILGLLIVSIVRAIEHFSPNTLSDFFLGFFSGLSFVFISVYLVSFGSDLYHILSKR